VNCNAKVTLFLHLFPAGNKETWFDVP
jgi:hypothetical protein